MNATDTESRCRRRQVGGRIQRFCIAALVSVCCVQAAPAQTSDTIWADGRLIEPDEDEFFLWRNSDRLEQWLLTQSGLLYEDAALDAYLTGLAKRLLYQILGTAEPDVRVRVLLSPELNAFALANGALFLHTGILARMDNEAQLAVLLGHELTHYTHRHQYREMRAERRRMIFGAVFGGLLGAAVGGSGYAQLGVQIGGQAGQVFAMASMSGYSRNREREADEIGLRAAAALGYDAGEGLALFEHLRREIESLGVREPYFFATHPRVVERIESFDRLIGSGGLRATPEVLVNRESFLNQIVDLLLDNAELDLTIGREETARMAIDKHSALRPGFPRAYFLRGEYYRHVGRAARSYDEAIANYELAVEHDEGYAAAYLELGLIGRLVGDPELSRSAFQRYLELRPDAIDRGIVESYLGERAVVPAVGAVLEEAAP